MPTKPRLAYQDKWVVDRTLFEYVNQGSCSCCGVSHAVMDAAKFFELCSDMETDDQRRERFSPWPPFMKDELWKDMVLIRAKLKASLPNYQQFVATELQGFSSWWEELPVCERRKVFQMPVDEVKAIYHDNFGVKKAYAVLSCALLEQVRRFRETGMPPDGRTEWEVDFEDVLEVERGAFVVHREYIESEEGMRSFLHMMGQAGGLKLLPRRDKKSWQDPQQCACEHHGHFEVSADAKHDDEEEEEEEAEPEPVPDAPSFRSDRRIMRLIIFRYFADRAIRRYRQFVGGNVAPSSINLRQSKEAEAGAAETDEMKSFIEPASSQDSEARLPPCPKGATARPPEPIKSDRSPSVSPPRPVGKARIAAGAMGEGKEDTVED